MGATGYGIYKWRQAHPVTPQGRDHAGSITGVDVKLIGHKKLDPVDRQPDLKKSRVKRSDSLSSTGSGDSLDNVLGYQPNTNWPKRRRRLRVMSRLHASVSKPL